MRPHSPPNAESLIYSAGAFTWPAISGPSRTKSFVPRIDGPRLSRASRTSWLASSSESALPPWKPHTPRSFCNGAPRRTGRKVTRSPSDSRARVSPASRRNASRISLGMTTRPALSMVTVAAINYRTGTRSGSRARDRRGRFRHVGLRRGRRFFKQPLSRMHPGGELQHDPVRIHEIDRAHDRSFAHRLAMRTRPLVMIDQGAFDAAGLQPLAILVDLFRRHVEGDVVHRGMRGNEIVRIGRLADIPARRRYPRCSLGRIRKAEECEQIALANVEEKVMPPPVGHLYVPHHRHAQDVVVEINRLCHVAADQGEMVYPPKLKPWILQSLLCAHIALSCLAAWLFILFRTPESFLARHFANNTRPIFIRPPSTSEPASSSRCPVPIAQKTLPELIQARTANLRHRCLSFRAQAGRFLTVTRRVGWIELWYARSHASTHFIGAPEPPR